MSHINQKSIKALAAAKAQHSAQVATKAAEKKTKTEKTVKFSAALKALKVGTILIALLSGSKGEVCRRVKYLGKGAFKLIQNNAGLSYDGETFVIDENNKLVGNKQARLEAGNYVCNRGARATVRVMSEREARKLISKRITVERNGKEIKLLVSRLNAQYAASIERFTSGKEHFFQWESERLATNAKHYGALVKS